jgi:hypothetical protein
MRLAAFALSLAFAGAVMAADISGKWTAQVPGRGGEPQETTFNFKVQGTTLTGTMSTQRGEAQISDGKVEGDKVSFTVVRNFGGNEVKLLYKGSISGNEIKFTREGGQGPAREFTAKRAVT